MARTVATDFMHSMRFHVVMVNTGPGEAKPGFLTGVGRNAGTGEAGFTSCTLPEISIEPVTYREGNFIYERKFAGLPTVSDVTLQRGVARGDSSFWAWAAAAAEGGPLETTGEYRADIDIQHFHREQALANSPNFVERAGGQTAPVFLLGNGGPLPARVYHCKEAFATRHKVAGDLDSTASEISIMELDFAMEYFTVEEK